MPWETSSAEYPLIDQYLQDEFRLAGTTDFGNADAPDGYRVLIARSRQPVRIDPVTQLPCFR
jgi:hypothetical protein